MTPIFIKIPEIKFIKYFEGKELPEGEWNVMYPDGTSEVTKEEDMPDFWKKEISKATKKLVSYNIRKNNLGSKA